MQLKHKGKTVQVTLTVTETRLLEKAADLLTGVALLPCDAADIADKTAAGVYEVVTAIGKPSGAETEKE